MTTCPPAVLLLLFAVASPVAAQSSSVITAVDHVMQEAVKNRVLAGATVGVAQGGRILFIRGYGLANLEQRVAATDSTVYRIGSTTKQFTAAALLRLVDQGKASLDDSLAKYFPDFPRASEVTLEQLLNHLRAVLSATRYTHVLRLASPRNAGRLRHTCIRISWCRSSASSLPRVYTRAIRRVTAPNSSSTIWNAAS